VLGDVGALDDLYVTNSLTNTMAIGTNGVLAMAYTDSKLHLFYDTLDVQTEAIQAHGTLYVSGATRFASAVTIFAGGLTVGSAALASFSGAINVSGTATFSSAASFNNGGTITTAPMNYSADLSGSYVPRSLVDKAYVDSKDLTVAKGSATGAGNGSTALTITVAHGLGSTPTTVMAIAKGLNSASASFTVYATADATNINIITTGVATNAVNYDVYYLAIK